MHGSKQFEDEDSIIKIMPGLPSSQNPRRVLAAESLDEVIESQINQVEGIMPLTAFAANKKSTKGTNASPIKLENI